MECKISIIIPVYNVEAYISRCLNSLIEQTYKNIEIICVNDGSTDNSGKICEQYAKKDRRVNVVNKKNKGVGDARCIGIEMASGSYIGFVDPDDWIELDMYRQLLNAIESVNADISICGIFKNYNGQQSVMKNVEEIVPGTMNLECLFKYVFIRDLYRGVGAYLVNKLFDRKLFYMNGRMSGFLKRLKVGEDVLLFTVLALNSKKNVYISEPFYHYFQRKDSLFHQQCLDSREDSLKAYYLVKLLFEKYHINKDIIGFVKRFYVYHASCLAEIAIRSKNIKKLGLYQLEMRRFFDDYVRTNQDRPERIKKVIDLINYRFS